MSAELKTVKAHYFENFDLKPVLSGGTPEVIFERKGVSFTLHQLSLLSLKARGFSIAEIARQLNVSPQTVKNHLTAISQRIGPDISQNEEAIPVFEELLTPLALHGAVFVVEEDLEMRFPKLHVPISAPQHHGKVIQIDPSLTAEVDEFIKDTLSKLTTVS